MRVDAATAPAAVAAMAAVHHGLGTWEQKATRYIGLSEFSRRKFIEGEYEAGYTAKRGCEMLTGIYRPAIGAGWKVSSISPMASR